MKIRAGFVSNSSSSSFCVYGKEVSDSTTAMYNFIKRSTFDEYKKTRLEELEQLRKEYDLIQKYDTWDALQGSDEDEDIINSIESNLNDLKYDVLTYVGNGEYMIGLTPWEISDNETGAEFKEKAKKFVTDLTGEENPKLTWECNVYYD